MRNIKADLLAHLDSVIQEYETIRNSIEDTNQFTDMNFRQGEVQGFLSSAMAAIERIAGQNSPYTKQGYQILSEKRGYLTERIPALAGVVKSLRNTVDKDYLRSVTELIHGDVFGDFLEMAEHLLGEGYKDPAAVLTGGVLEEHIRQLCTRNAISVSLSSGAAKKADQMNSELVAAGVYSKLDQKSVTAWLDLRNKAAHGRYSEYTKEQVTLFIQSIRDFIVRNPA